MLHSPVLAVNSAARLACVVLGLGLLACCQSATDRTAAADEIRRADVVLAADGQVFEGRVPARATLESLLRQQDLPGDLTAALVASVGTVFNPRALRADQTYRVTRTLDGLFREFRYQIDPDRFVRVVLRNGGQGGPPEFDVEVVPVPKETTLDAVAVEITRARPSLVGALDASGEHVQLALQLADIFGGMVDFNSDLQAGDRIQVLFERVRQDGDFVGYGAVKAAVLETGGRRITATRYPGPDGKPGWYDEEGRSLKRQFLRSPLPFEPRITSRFSYRRLHPIYGDFRAHLGVDYGAPVGTRVYAVAAGVVEAAEWSGGAGRMVKLRHGGGYETAYLHLSSFAPGIRPGARVDQGDLVGYVGMSGDATGPHLDYRIAKNGVYVNPLVELSKMPPGDPIADDARDAFTRERDAMMTELGTRAAGPAPWTGVLPRIF